MIEDTHHEPAGNRDWTVACLLVCSPADLGMDREEGVAQASTELIADPQLGDTTMLLTTDLPTAAPAALEPAHDEPIPVVVAASSSERVRSDADRLRSGAAQTRLRQTLLTATARPDGAENWMFGVLLLTTGPEEREAAAPALAELAGLPVLVERLDLAPESIGTSSSVERICHKVLELAAAVAEKIDVDPGAAYVRESGPEHSSSGAAGGVGGDGHRDVGGEALRAGDRRRTTRRTATNAALSSRAQPDPPSPAPLPAIAPDVPIARTSDLAPREDLPVAVQELPVDAAELLSPPSRESGPRGGRLRPSHWFARSSPLSRRVSTTQEAMDRAADLNDSVGSIYVLMLGEMMNGNQLHQRRTELTLELAKRLATSEDPGSRHAWYLSLLVVGSGVSRHGCPRDARSIRRRDLPKSTGSAIDLQDCSQAVSAYLRRDTASFGRRGLTVTGSHVVLLAAEFPFTDPASLKTYGELCAAAATVTWVLLDDIDEAMDLTEPRPDAVLPDHDDVVDEVARRILGGTTDPLSRR